MMGIPLANAGIIPSTLERIAEFNRMRSAQIGMTLTGKYVNDYLTQEEQNVLETVRENYCRRRIAESVIYLETLGVEVDLDFDIGPYRNPPAEVSDEL